MEVIHLRCAVLKPYGTLALVTANAVGCYLSGDSEDLVAFANFFARHGF